MPSRLRSFLLGAFATVLLVLAGGVTPAFVGAAFADDRSPVMKAFEADAPKISATLADSEQKEKHKILFMMGAALLFLVVSTAVLGVAMALFGKEVFVAHMVTAGATVFLTVAHAVTAMVWFYPF